MTFISIHILVKMIVIIIPIDEPLVGSPGFAAAHHLRRVHRHDTIDRWAAGLNTMLIQSQYEYDLKIYYMMIYDTYKS